MVELENIGKTQWQEVFEERKCVFVERGEEQIMKVETTTFYFILIF